MSDCRACLEAFVQGRLPLATLEECLAGSVEMHFWDTNERRAELLMPLPEVHFGADDVDRQLQRFLARDLPARALSDWAAALRLLGAYCVDGGDDYQAEVWNVLDELMSPDAWGPLTVEGALALRGRLLSLAGRRSQ